VRYSSLLTVFLIALAVAALVGKLRPLGFSHGL
jgi:hypothetical protein